MRLRDYAGTEPSLDIPDHSEVEWHVVEFDQDVLVTHSEQIALDAGRKLPFGGEVRRVRVTIEKTVTFPAYN